MKTKQVTVKQDDTFLTKQYGDPVLDDFRNFLYLVWKHLGLPDPTPVQYDIAHYLQYGKRRTIIMAFRGVGKSWITSAFVCWILLRNPLLKILVVSASKVRADDFSAFTKRLINEMPMLASLKAKNGQRDSSVAFDVGPATPDHAPSVKSLGITGQLSGSRADVIIPDDIEVQNNSLTQMMRDKLADAVKEFDSILKPGGYIRYLGTPQTEMSLYNTLAERGYEQRIWCARYPKQREVELYGAKLAPFIVNKLTDDPSLSDTTYHNKYGKPVDPLRFDEEDLLEREASNGRSGFALQFMLDTTISDGDRYPLRLSDLIVMSTDNEVAPVKVAWGSGPEQVLNDVPNAGLAGDRIHRPMFIHKDFIPYSHSVMWIDPSGRGADETSYVVLKMLNGYLYLRRMGGFRDGYGDETLTKLATIARDEKVNYIGVESNFGDGMFSQLFSPYLQRIHPCKLEEERSVGMKEARIIDTLEPVMNQHRLVVDIKLFDEDIREADAKYQLFYQMTRITKERGALGKDDRIDVLAMAVAYYSEMMHRDVESVMKSHEETLKQKEVDKFLSMFNKNHNSRKNWTNNI